AALLPLSSPQPAATSPATAITPTSHRLRARTRTVVLLLISSPPTLARHISDLLPPVLPRARTPHGTSKGNPRGVPRLWRTVDRCWSSDRGNVMRRSTDRILTTHVGALPAPPDVWARLDVDEARLRAAVVDVCD